MNPSLPEIVNAAIALTSVGLINAICRQSQGKEFFYKKWYKGAQEWDIHAVNEILTFVRVL